MEYLRSLYNHTLAGYFSADAEDSAAAGLLTEEEVEEYRMLTGFEVKEIKRFYQQYREFTDNDDHMTLDTFLSIPPLDFNPLKNRIAIHFGFVKGKTEINFKEFVCGLSLFNAIGSRESKIKIAFQIQDFDEDGVLSKEDLTSYINLITADGLTGDTRRDNDVEMIVDQLLDESYNGQETRGDSITFQNFHRIMITMDFQSKMRIPI